MHKCPVCYIPPGRWRSVFSCKSGTPYVVYYTSACCHKFTHHNTHHLPHHSACPSQELQTCAGRHKSFFSPYTGLTSLCVCVCVCVCVCPSLHPTSGLRVGALCKSDWAPYRGAQVDLLTTRLQPRLPIVYCTRTLLFVTRVCTCALSSSAGCWGWLPSGGWAGLSSPSSCACTHVVVDHPSGWSGAAGGVWNRPPRRLPTRGRICVRQRVCVKGFSLRVPSPFTLGAPARAMYVRYVRAYARTDADVAVCVFGWVGGLCPKAYE